MENTMFTIRQLSQWWFAVTSNDPVRYALNRGLSFILTTGMLLTCIVVLAFIGEGQVPLLKIAATALLLPLLLIAWGLNRRGTLHGVMLTICIIFTTTIVTIDPTTYTAPLNKPIIAPVFFAVPIAIATLFIKPWAGIWTAIIQMILLVIYMAVLGIPSGSILNFFIFGTINFLVITSILVVGSTIFFRTLHESLTANAALRALAANLDATVIEQTADLRTANRILAERTTALEAAKAEIERREMLRVQEINAATHDLRRNLQIFQSVADILFRAADYEHDPISDARRHVAVFWTTFRGMATYVNHMRDAVLLRHSRLDLRAEAVDLIPLIERVQQQAQLRDIADACHLTVAFADVGHAWCDAERIERVLQNLVDNALKSTYQRFQGQPGGMLRIELDCSDHQIICCVIDNGIGIAPEELSVLGQPFVRGVYAHEHEGMGLGLAFCKGVIQQSQGTFTLTSDGVNRGTTVTFCLPIAAIHHDQAGSAPEHALTGRSILLVEDDTRIAEALAGALQAVGAIVSVTDGVSEAKQLLQQHGYGIVVVDQHLGEGEATGTDLINWLLAQPHLQHVRRISFSGAPISAILQNLPTDAFHGFLTKPLSAHDFVNQLLQLVQHSTNYSHANRTQ
jgi:signal transduction histidine kinase/ActR/RegA family two-component response regulator